MTEDLVNSPEHYNKGDIECIDAIEAAVGDFASYCQGNAIKYLYRHAYKGNPIQDLEKAIWYINKLKETYETQRTAEKGDEEPNGSASSRGSIGQARGGRPEEPRELPETD